MGLNTTPLHLEKIRTAVDDEMISDVPLCTILSGGIDSTIITYLLQKNRKCEKLCSHVNPTRKSKYKDDLYYYVRMPLQRIWY